MKPLFYIFLLIILTACSTEENAKSFVDQGYQDARRLRLTSKQDCIFTMINTNASQLKGCFAYIEEFQRKARELGQSDFENDEFEPAPSADVFDNAIEEDSNECVISEGGETYIGECNNYLQ